MLSRGLKTKVMARLSHLVKETCMAILPRDIEASSHNMSIHRYLFELVHEHVGLNEVS